MSDFFSEKSATQQNNAPTGLQVASGELLVGEVIETSLTQYTAQTYKLDEPPPFGGLVRVHDRAGNCEIYGAVFHIATGGLDPARRATTRGSTARDEQVYQENPQLSRLLKTEFGVLVLGCSRNQGATFQYVYPDYPPPLHYSVALCDAETLINFTQEKGFLRTILETRRLPSEELAAALLRRATKARGASGRAFLVESLRYVARQLKQDYDRFKVITEKCEDDQE